MKRKLLIAAIVLLALMLAALPVCGAVGYFALRQHKLNQCMDKATSSYVKGVAKHSWVNEDGERVNSIERSLGYAILYQNSMTRCQIMWGNSWWGGQDALSD